MLAIAVAVMPDVLAIQSGESTQGSEFYFSFMRARSERDKTLTLFVSSEADGKIELTNPQTGITKTYQISAGKNTIPLATVAKNKNEEVAAVAGNHNDCYSVLANTPLDRGYYAHATDASGDDMKVSL